MLGDGDDVATSDLGDSDASVGLVGSVEINMVGTNTGSDGDLEVLGLGETLCGEVTRVETGETGRLAHAHERLGSISGFLRSGNDDLGVNQVLVKLGTLTLLV